MEPLRPRGYQMEMFQQSMQRNIIVAIPTGGGKTYIAALRINAELEKGEIGKRVWFLCPTVALAKQQCDALTRNLPPVYRLQLLSGEDDVDHWKSPRVWEHVLTGVSVVVCTYQVLTDALNNGYVNLKTISLLVFDEAHHCQKNHASNRIMQDFYHPAKRERTPIPAILGLTASPIHNKVNDLEKIEANLDAISRAPRQGYSELLRHVNIPDIQYYIFPPQAGEDPTLLQQLKRLLASAVADIRNDPYVASLVTNKPDAWDPRYEDRLHKAMYCGKTWCQEQFRRLVRVCEDTYTDLGLFSSHVYLTTCLDKVSKRQGPSLFISDDELREKEVVHVSKFLSQVDVAEDSIELSDAANHSPKVNLLLRILATEMTEKTTAILFVKTRASVKLLSDLISLHPTTRDIVRVGTFVGSSSYQNRPSHISELIDATGQGNTLEELRSGIKNIIVATNVVEEGIDISACNLVICYDRPANVRSFIQRRGRARQASSRLVVFFSSNEAKMLAKWQEVEEEMKRKYQDKLRQLQELKNFESEYENYRELNIEKTGAKLTLSNAISRLYRFCTKIPSVTSSFASLPLFIPHNDKDHDRYSCEVLLPNTLDENLRRYQSCYENWESSALAKRDAAFSAVAELHKVGLLNDRFMPLDVFDEANDAEQKLTEVRPNIAEVEEQMDIWPHIAKQWGCKGQVYACSARFSLYNHSGGEKEAKVLLISSVPFPTLSNMTLYVDQWTNGKVRFSTDDACVSMNYDVKVGRQITRLILRSALRSRVEPGKADFPVLFLPYESLSDPENWLEMMSGSRTCQYLTDITMSTKESEENVGIVRDQSTPDNPYKFFGLQQVQEETAPEDGEQKSEPVTMIQVRRLPKRRDLMHPIPASDAPAPAKYEYLDPTTCLVDKLPAFWADVSLAIPSMLHHLSIQYIAEELRRSLFSDVFSRHDLHYVLTAISAPSAREARSYQRLEFLGDSLLKCYMSMALLVDRPYWHEGYLSQAKDQFVSNANLAQVAQRVGLGKFILHKPFTGLKWRPRYINDLLVASDSAETSSTKREISTKILADIVEALLGGAWLAGGEESLLRCLRVFFPSKEWRPASESLRMLKERAHSVPVSTAYMSQLSQLVGHDFGVPSIMLEAMTPPGPSTLGSTPSYQRLEFLGDTFLDLAVTIRLYKHSAELPEGTMHRLRIATVNGQFLSFCMMDTRINVERAILPSVSGKGNRRSKHRASSEPLENESVPVTLIDFLRGNRGRQAMSDLAQLHARFDQHSQTIKQRLADTVGYPWSDLAAFRPPKVTSDLIESTLAAIAIDQEQLALDIGDEENSPTLQFLNKFNILPWLNTRLTREDSTAPKYDPFRVCQPREEVGELAIQEQVRYERWSDSTNSWVTGSGVLQDQTLDRLSALSVAQVEAAAQAEIDDDVPPGEEAAIAELNPNDSGGGARITCPKVHYCRIRVGERLLCEASGGTVEEAHTRVAEHAVGILRREKQEKMLAEQAAVQAAPVGKDSELVLESLLEQVTEVSNFVRSRMGEELTVTAETSSDGIDYNASDDEFHDTVSTHV